MDRQRKSAHQDGRRHKNLPHGRRGDARAFNIDLTIDRGEYVSIAGPSAAASPRCSPSSVCSILRAAKIFLEWQGRFANHTCRTHTQSVIAKCFVFQAFNLIAISRLRNVELPSLTETWRRRAKEKNRTRPRTRGDVPSEKHFPAQLSGGSSNVLRSARPRGDPLILMAMSPQAISDSQTVKPSCSFSPTFTECATICLVTHDPRYSRFATAKVHLFDARSSDRQPNSLPLSRGRFSTN